MAAVASGRPVGLDATPTRKTKAIKRLETLEDDLDNEEKLDMMDLFQKDVGMADAYMSIQGEDLRKGWVQRRLRELS